ncbi:MAG: hypothetical protein RR100_08535, partial [Comamonas sp.]
CDRNLAAPLSLCVRIVETDFQGMDSPSRVLSAGELHRFRVLRELARFPLLSIWPAPLNDNDYQFMQMIQSSQR